MKHRFYQHCSHYQYTYRHSSTARRTQKVRLRLPYISSTSTSSSSSSKLKYVSYVASLLFITTATTHQLHLQLSWGGWRSTKKSNNQDSKEDTTSASSASSSATTTTQPVEKIYHPSINVTTRAIHLTDEQKDQLHELRSYLHSIFHQCCTLEHRSMLAYDNSTKDRRWDSEYTMHDLAAIRRGINPSHITVQELHQLYENDQHHQHQGEGQEVKTDWPPNVDDISDHTLLRFLLARKCRIDAAAESLAKTLAWRSHYGVDELASLKYTPLHTLLQSLTVADVHKRCDKHGRPIYIDQMPDVAVFNDFISPDEVMASHVYMVEQMMKKLQQSNEELQSSQQPQHDASTAVSSFKPAVDKIVQIHDLKGLTFAHRHLIKHFTNTSHIDATHYPQTAGVIYLINSPHIFTYMYNSLIKPLLPAITASKIRIYGDDYAQYLCQDLGEENVPMELGGQCDCSGVGKGCLPLKVPLTDEQYHEYAPDHVKARKTSRSWF